MQNPFRGDTRRYPLTFTDSAGAAIDITGWTIWFTLKEDPDVADVQAALQVSSTAGDDAADLPLQGKMFIEVFYAVEPGQYHFDYQRVIAGKAVTILAGKICVKQDVTKDVA